MNDRKADTFAAVDPEALEREAIAAIEAASSLEGLDEVRVRYLGRKSELAQSLHPAQFTELMGQLRTIAKAVDRFI